MKPAKDYRKSVVNCAGADHAVGILSLALYSLIPQSENFGLSLDNKGHVEVLFQHKCDVYPTS